MTGGWSGGFHGKGICSMKFWGGLGEREFVFSRRVNVGNYTVVDSF